MPIHCCCVQTTPLLTKNTRCSAGLYTAVPLLTLLLLLNKKILADTGPLVADHQALYCTHPRTAIGPTLESSFIIHSQGAYH